MKILEKIINLHLANLSAQIPQATKEISKNLAAKMAQNHRYSNKAYDGNLYMVFLDANRMSIEPRIYRNTKGFLYVLTSKPSRFKEEWRAIAVLSGQNVAVTPTNSYLLIPITEFEALTALESASIKFFGHNINEITKSRLRQAKTHQRKFLK